MRLWDQKAFARSGPRVTSIQVVAMQLGYHGELEGFGLDSPQGWLAFLDEKASL